MVMKILLVESDVQLQKDLQARLAANPFVEIVERVNTTEEAFNYLRTNRVHAVFSNIQPAPPEMTSDGSCLALFVAQYYPDIQAVLYGSLQNILDKTVLSACSGILTLPFNSYAVQQVITRLHYVFRLQQKSLEAANRSIMVKTKEGYRLLVLKDILFIERSDRKNRIVMDNGTEILLYRYTLDELEQMLEGSDFYRCYQSFIVNLSKIAEIRADSEAKSFTIVFEGNKNEIMLSRNKYVKIVELLREKYAKVSL